MRSKYKQLKNDIAQEYRDHRTRFYIRLAILLLAIALIVVKRSIWTPDTLLIIVIVIGFVFGQAKEFIYRFVPFLGMLVVYDGFRGIADDLNKNVHFWEMINFDRWLGMGQIVSSHLQQWWWHGHVTWLEWYFYFLYTLHFLVPLVVGVLLWKLRPRLYWPFVWSIVGISFAAFITYIAFPAAPPWMAKELGYLAEPLHRISSDVWWAMGVENFSEFYKNISPNAVAAVPSLHSAYPLIAALFVIRAFTFRRTWWVLVYPLSMWIGVVYLGEHYVFDIVAAVVFVLIGMYSVLRGFHYHQARKKSL